MNTKKTFAAFALFSIASASIAFAYDAGTTFTVQAGATVTVTDDDIAEFNTLASAEFADETGVLEFNTSTPPSIPITGAGTIRKTSSAAWTLNVARSDFTGTWDFAGGKSTITVRYALYAESSSGDVYVRSGATLEIDSNAFRFGSSRTLHLCGTGCDSQGALRMKSASSTANNMLRTIALDGDATLSMPTSASVFYMQGTPSTGDAVALNGYSLTISCGGGSNNNILNLYSGRVSGPGKIILNNTANSNYGGLCLHGAKLLDPSVEIVLNNYTRVNVYNHTTTNYLAKLTVEGSLCRLTHEHQFKDTACAAEGSHDFWGGEVNLKNSTSRLRLGMTTPTGETAAFARANYAFGIVGPVTGPGSLSFATESYWKYGNYSLTCPTNTYTGSTQLDGGSGATLFLPCSNNIPVYAKANSNVPITLKLSEREHGWGPASIARFAEGFVCTGDASCRRVVVDASALETHKVVFEGISDELSGDMIDGIVGAPGTELEFRSPLGRPLCPLAVSNTVTLTGTATMFLTNPPVAKAGYLYGGDIVVDGAKDLRLAAAHPYRIGAAHGAKCMKILNSTWTQPLNTTDFSSLEKDAIVVGARDGATYDSPGDLRIGAGAVVTGRLHVAASTRSRGRILQTGGEVAVLSAFSSNDKGFSVGGTTTSEGYYELVDGTLKVLGAMNIGRYSRGFFLQRGGSFSVMAHPSSSGTPTTYFGFGDASRGHFMATGGTARFPGPILTAANASAKSILTVGGDASVTCDSVLAYGYASGAEVIVNLAGSGRLKFQGFEPRYNVSQYSSYGWWPRLYLNADGGTLATGRGGPTILGGPQISSLSSTAYPPIDRIAFYRGGLTIDVGSYEPTAYGVMTPASGKGVASIPFAGISGAVASPWVTISGDGHGASAIVDVDRDTGNATGVTVVSPGFDYTWAKATIFSGVDGTTNTYSTVDCVLADNDGSGGLTVKGTSGTLTLTATNTYLGATTLAGGTLKLGCDRAIPADSTIVLAGGKLVMNGKVLSDGSSMPKNWAVDMNRVRTGGAVTYGANLAFPEGATFTILNVGEVPEDAPARTVLLQVTGTVTGAPDVQGLDTSKAKARWVGNKLVMVNVQRGIILFVR